MDRIGVCVCVFCGHRTNEFKEQNSDGRNDDDVDESVVHSDRAERNQTNRERCERRRKGKRRRKKTAAKESEQVKQLRLGRGSQTE